LTEDGMNISLVVKERVGGQSATLPAALDVTDYDLAHNTFLVIRAQTSIDE